jgi:hypothetical protein
MIPLKAPTMSLNCCWLFLGSSRIAPITAILFISTSKKIPPALTGGYAEPAKYPYTDSAAALSQDPSGESERILIPKALL